MGRETPSDSASATSRSGVPLSSSPSKTARRSSWVIRSTVDDCSRCRLANLSVVGTGLGAGLGAGLGTGLAAEVGEGGGIPHSYTGPALSATLRIVRLSDNLG